MEGDEEYAYVYYMHFFNILSFIKKSSKSNDNKVSAQRLFYGCSF